MIDDIIQPPIVGDNEPVKVTIKNYNPYKMYLVILSCIIVIYAIVFCLIIPLGFFKSFERYGINRLKDTLSPGLILSVIGFVLVFIMSKLKSKKLIFVFSKLLNFNYFLIIGFIIMYFWIIALSDYK
jgi:hypothetical protein